MGDVLLPCLFPSLIWKASDILTCATCDVYIQEHSCVKAGLIGLSQLVNKAFVPDPVESLTTIQRADVHQAFVFTA
ncbi:hypothetical protein DPMN_107757 [Dreissena polymorpha]|uniref:Uncharacterized protein n=1 Tax=Dreissena polymorpha TaxID=45954 RepID=A0A9D4K7R8_DREPO|nr:hypothetical protein DPMN_107757 [Dreissena polymorpha]